MHPILFKLGSIEIRSFSVVILIAVVLGCWLVKRRCERYQLPWGELTDLIMWVVVAGVLGARLLFIAQEFGSMKPSEVFSLRFDGLTSFGGILGGLIVVAIIARRRKRSMLAYLDILMPSMLLGQAIGRVACLLNGCCYGVACPANFPLGIPATGHEGLVHPAQIYETAMLLPLLGVLLAFERRRPAMGQVAMLGLAFLGAARFIYEFWRAGTEEQVRQGLASSTYWGALPITQAQAVALLLVVAGLVGIALTRKNEPDTLPVPSAA